VEALGAQLLSDHEDIVKVTLFFKGGCRADLSASRISLKTFRKIRVFQPDAYLTLDYSERSLRVYRKKSAVVRSLKDIRMEKPSLDRKEPLQAELEHFTECVRNGTPSHVPGEHGRDALSLAWEIHRQMKFFGADGRKFAAEVTDLPAGRPEAERFENSNR
jgi:predicted dehydrogenase